MKLLIFRVVVLSTLLKKVSFYFRCILFTQGSKTVESSLPKNWSFAVGVFLELSCNGIKYRLFK